MKDFNIRTATENDVRGILRLIDRQIKYHLSINPKYKRDIPPEYSESGIRGLINSTNDKFLVAEKNGDLIGLFIAGIIKKPVENPSNIKPQAKSNIVSRVKRILIQKRPENIRYIQSGFIKECFVDESHRKMGVGSSLLDQGMKYFKDNNIKDIMLIVYGGNDLGRTFWSRHGFSDFKTMMYKDF